jgi:hypothetical protein
LLSLSGLHRIFGPTEDPPFETTLREGVAGDVVAIEVLGEALSFMVRKSLLRVLREGLLHHFKTATMADAFFSAQGLTKNLLRKKAKKS